jgi:hypothetical protein
MDKNERYSNKQGKRSVTVYVFLVLRVIYTYGQSLLRTPNLQQSLRKTSTGTTMKTVINLLVFLVVACLLIAQLTAGKLDTATVLCSLTLRSFLRVNLHGRSPKGPRFTANVYSPKDT